MSQPGEAEAWNAAKAADTLEAYGRFVQAWPNGVHTAEAKAAAQAKFDAGRGGQ